MYPNPDCVATVPKKWKKRKKFSLSGVAKSFAFIIIIKIAGVNKAVSLFFAWIIKISIGNNIVFSLTDLTWEQLKKFHASHYHPSNARFYTYGNIPLERHLARHSGKLAEILETKLAGA
jgi:hypothetical protein